MLSRRAVLPGSNNPFITPCDNPPHLATSFQQGRQQRHADVKIPPFPRLDLSSSDEEPSPPYRLAPPHTHITTHRALTGPPIDLDDDNTAVKEKTMAGVPTWPANLCLSFNANNGLEWSCKLINSLEIGQLDVYLLGILKCPDRRIDQTSSFNWRGNDHMILAYTHSCMYPTESQLIAHCETSAEAFKFLWHCHEKRGGLSQIQLIQKMMQVCFDNSPTNHDVIMNHLRDLIYRVERIGHVDVTRLGLLFTVQSLSMTHPTVYEALSSALMDSSITLEVLDNRLHLFYEIQATQNVGQLMFPLISLILSQIPLPPIPSSAQSSPSSPTITLPASLPPQANICPNCKKSDHSIEFCISPGGKMEGLSATEAIVQQCAAHDTSRARPPPNPSASSSLMKINNDGMVWIGGVKYQPAPKPTTQASVAEVEIKAAMTAADQGEYMDWWTSNNNDPNWGGDDLNDTATFLLEIGRAHV